MEEALIAEVRAGLTQPQRTLPAWLLYDALGSALFEAITLLPEYGLTRADERLMRQHAPEIAAALPGLRQVAELGSGSGRKTRHVLRALADRPVYYPIDISDDALRACAAALDDVAAVRALHADYLAGLEHVQAQREDGPLLVLFLGSTIGNFAPDEAEALLRRVRASLQPGDALLLGADLVKDECIVRLAYDDPTGVTAAFNRNVLGQLNRELGADFDLTAFAHEARYDATRQRVEMHLRALTDQPVRVPGAALEFTIKAGETIWTESSHKFTPEQLTALAASCGFSVRQTWCDDEWPFTESLWQV